MAIPTRPPVSNLQNLQVSTNQTIEINAGTLAEIITDVCDVENLCSDEVLEQFQNQPLVGGIGTGRPGTTAQSALIDQRIQGVQTPAGIRKKKDITSAEKKLSFKAGKLSDNLFGKINLFIDGQILGLSYGDFLNIQALEDNSTYGTLDPLRGRLGSYWSLDKQTNKVVFLRSFDDIKKKSLLDYDSNSLEREGFFINQIDAKYDDDFEFGNFQEKYDIIFKEKSFQDTSGKLSKNLINAFSYGGNFSGSIKGVDDYLQIRYSPTFLTNVDFVDVNYSFYSPYTEKEIQRTQKPASSLLYNVVPDYNFYIKKYENLLGTTIPENNLPNLYALEISNKNEEVPQAIQNIVTLKGKIKNTKIPSLMPNSEHMKVKRAQQYFESFSDSYTKTSNKFKDKNNKKFKNVIFSSKEVKRLQTYIEKKYVYPLYVDLKFSMDKTSKFSSILQIANLKDKMVAKIADKVAKGQMQQLSMYVQAVESQNLSDVSNTKEITTQSRKSIRFIDVEDLIKEIREQKGGLLDLDNSFYVGDLNDLENTKETEENKFLNAIYYAIFKNKMTDFLNETTRTHRAIVNGNQCYTETFMYRIAKYKGANLTTPIQNVFIINDSELDIVNYVDTQVKYDQEYTYVVYSYQLVVGNKYRYTEATDTEVLNIKNVSVENQPFLIMAEIPYFVKQTRVYDAAPPPPEVNIVSYKDNDRNLLMLFNSAVNTYRATPVVVEEEDLLIYQKISQKQEVQFGDKLEFSSDDWISAYQIYRLEQKPTSYSDFSGNLLTTIDTDISKKSIQQASSAAFLESVQPNKKFYYMFRSIDIHGKPSNPSEVYEVEIINEKGTIFSVINIIELKEQQNKMATRTVKRFIQIVPSMMQAILDEQNTKYQEATTAKDAINNAKLGILDNPIWNKKYKMRLVSKQTKKIIDFDIKFDFTTKKWNKIGKYLK